MLMKDKIVSELNTIPTELLVQLYEFMQLIKKNYIYNQTQKNSHLLKKFIGCLDDKSAEEIRNCVNNEFQNIEGEW